MIEDILFIFVVILTSYEIGMNKILRKIISPISSPIYIYIFIGLCFLFYSSMIMQNNNLLSDFRLYAFSFIGLGFSISFHKKKHLTQFIIFIVFFWSIDVLYSYSDRVISGGLFALGKRYYINRLFQTFGFILAIYLFQIKVLKGWYKIYLFVAIVIFLINSTLEITRATYLYLIIFSSIFLFLRGHLTIRNVIIMGINSFLLYSFFFSGQIYEIYSQISDVIHLTGSVYTRYIGWQILFDRIMAHPFIGHGFGAEGSGIDLRIFEYIGDEKGVFLGTAHNAHLIMVFYIGFVGFLSYSVLSCYFIYKASKKLIPKDETYILLYQITAAGIPAFYFQTATQPISVSFHLYFWFYLIFLIAAITIPKYDKISVAYNK